MEICTQNVSISDSFSNMTIFTLQDIQQYMIIYNQLNQSYISNVVSQCIRDLDIVVVDISPSLTTPTMNEHSHVYNNRNHNSIVVRKNTDSFRRSSTDTHNDKERARKISKNVISEEWKALKTVKPINKEGIEKEINELRMVLNKISNKNYDTQRDQILLLIKKCKMHYDAIDIVEATELNKSEEINSCLLSPTSEYLNKIGHFIFDIASTNKFYGEVYADLYKVLINEYNIFERILQEFVKSFQNMIKKIQYVDPSVNYDAYCEYTKLNDKRRATTSFLVYLMNRSVLSENIILEFIKHFQCSLNEFVNQEGYEDEVNEITEILYLLISLGKDKLQKTSIWKDEILPEVVSFSNKKSKEYKSLSSRTVFKCKDILKIIA